MPYLKLIMFQKKSNSFYARYIMRTVPLAFSKFKLERRRNLGEFVEVIIISVGRKRAKKGI
jgi:hypothetical protein